MSGGEGRLTVAVLGTGIMGAPMARNIARAGHDVRAWNRSIEKARPLEQDGVTVASSPAEAVDAAGIVLTMLADADATAAVAQDALAAALPGAVWLQTATVGIAGIERCAELAHTHDVTLVDSPVLGTRQPAEERKLVVLAAGPDDALDRSMPVLDAIGQRTLRVGEAGAGTRLKLALNAWVLAVTEATAETIALARRAPRGLVDRLTRSRLRRAVVRGAFADSELARGMVARIRRGVPETP